MINKEYAYDAYDAGICLYETDPWEFTLHKIYRAYKTNSESLTIEIIQYKRGGHSSVLYYSK